MTSRRGQIVAAARGWASSLSRAERWVLGILVLGALVLRAWAMAGVRPITYGLYDSGTYLAGAAGGRPGGLFYDVHHPVGYSVWLRIVGALTDSGTVLAMSQHALAVIAGVVLWFALRRLGLPLLLSAIGAALVLWNPEAVQLEHSIMSEALYIPALVLAFSGAAYAARSTGRAAAVCGFGAGLAAAVGYTARYPGLAWVPLVVVLIVVLRPWAERRRAVLPAACAVVGAVLVLVPYGVAQSRALDIGFEFTPGAGWNAYANIASDADCSKFTPPPGTRKLCDRTPPAKRPKATEFYSWDHSSPAFRLEPRGFPHSDDLFAAFAAAASPSVAKARNEADPAPTPLAQIESVVDGAENYTGSSAGALSPMAGRNPPIEANEQAIAAPLFALAPIGTQSLVTTYDDVKGVVRIHGWMVGAALVITVLGLAFARGFRLAALACWLFVAANWYAAAGYNARYAVPVNIVALLASILILAGVWRTWAARRGPRTASSGAEPSPAA